MTDPSFRPVPTAPDPAARRAEVARTRRRTTLTTLLGAACTLAVVAVAVVAVTSLVTHSRTYQDRKVRAVVGQKLGATFLDDPDREELRRAVIVAWLRHRGLTDPIAVTYGRAGTSRRVAKVTLTYATTAADPLDRACDALREVVDGYEGWNVPVEVVGGRRAPRVVVRGDADAACHEVGGS